ncbi:MAG: motility-associated protein, partial [Eubacteriales bacterium]|nr:motility-associated protein [Eubacteriales bacterium]
MDISSILGFIVGFGSIGLGYMMDGGNLIALWMLSAFVITVGGSIGALFVSCNPRDLIRLPGMMLEVFFKPKSAIPATIEYLVLLATKARQGGLLSLEKEIDASGVAVDPFIKRGVLMVVDGTDPEKIS